MYYIYVIKYVKYGPILFTHPELKVFKISTLCLRTYLSNRCLQFWLFITAFAKLRKATTSFAIYVCLSVFPPRRLMDRFLRNLILPRYLINGKIFEGKKALYTKCVFSFSTTFV
jgi:hypothetical protein